MSGWGMDGAFGGNPAGDSQESDYPNSAMPSDVYGEQPLHDPGDLTHSHAHRAFGAGDADAADMHSHPHEHIGSNAHRHHFGIPVSNSGRRPVADYGDTSPASRSLFLESLAAGEDLPEMPAQGLNERISQAEQELATAEATHHRTWEALQQAVADYLPTAEGNATLAELEEAEFHSHQAKDTAQSRLNALLGQWGAEETLSHEEPGRTGGVQFPDLEHTRSADDGDGLSADDRDR